MLTTKVPEASSTSNFFIESVTHDPERQDTGVLSSLLTKDGLKFEFSSRGFYM